MYEHFVYFNYKNHVFVVEYYNLGITQLLQKNIQQKEKGNM
jgi:hypothetical protein